MTEAPILICMRLADMHRVHPDQIERNCARCGELIAVYPSGQRALQLYPNLEIVCSCCQQPSREAVLAPGSEMEPFQSKPRTRQ